MTCEKYEPCTSGRSFHLTQIRMNHHIDKEYTKHSQYTLVHQAPKNKSVIHLPTCQEPSKDVTFASGCMQAAPENICSKFNKESLSGFWLGVSTMADAM
jgi:hypothetical protein